MFNLKYWLNLATDPQTHIWIEVTLVKETRKALLIEFDGRKIWLPKAWILSIKRNKSNPRPKIGAKQSQTEQTPQTIAIKIS
ncbi:MAG: hypothetical protein KKH11_03865, partial [Candidatus Omnitrophica bacterium]|nr:hypothetical protein [Candidatus Omnitrophota bacterium]